MRTEGGKFGAKSSKTLRRVGKNTKLNDQQDKVLKKISHVESELFEGQMLVKTKQHYETINKSERKRIHNRQQYSDNSEDEEEHKSAAESEEEIEEIIPQLFENQQQINEWRLKLKELQTKHQKTPFNELPDEVQDEIKNLQRELQKVGFHYEEFTGSINKYCQKVVMQKLSEVYSDKEIARKFLQTDAKSGKLLLKPSKQKEYVYDGKNNKQKKKAQLKNNIEHDRTESVVHHEMFVY